MTVLRSIHPEPPHPGTFPWLGDAAEELSMRQLRHHTKNALQRLLCQVTTCPGLQQDAAGRALARELERRIHLSAAISDALFGFTQARRSLDTRLEWLCRSLVGLMGDADQELACEVSVLGRVPGGMDDLLVRIAHELVGNAIKHGMTLRLVGRIEVVVDARDEGLTLSVIDDGWGLCHDGHVPEARGEGLRIATLLAESAGGSLSLHRDRCSTVARVTFPGADR